jgi:hypothetical protein
MTERSRISSKGSHSDSSQNKFALLKKGLHQQSGESLEMYIEDSNIYKEDWPGKQSSRTNVQK